MIFIFSCVLFIHRTWWRVKYPRAGYDTWYHITAARAIRKNKYRVPERTGQHFNRGRWDYPPLFPYLLSVLSDEAVVRYHYLIPPIFDLFSFITVEMFIVMSGAGPLGVVVAGMIYIFTPIVAIDVIQHTTPRPLGNFLFNMALALQLSYYFNGDWRFLVAALVPVILICLTHKFTLQAQILISAALAIFSQNIAFVLVTGAGILLAAAVSGGHYFTVLRGHLAFLNYYRTAGRKKYPDMYAVDRRRLMKILRLDSTASPALLLLVAVPLLGIPMDVFIFLAACFVAIYAVVSLNQFLFLGEPERYLELATIPVVMTALELPSKIPVLLLLSLVALTSIIGQYRIHRELRSRERMITDKNTAFEHYADDELLEACDFMRSYPGDRILTVPEYMQGGVFYHTGKMTQGTESAREYGEYMKEFPATPATIRDLVRKYGVDLVFLGKAACKDFDMSFARPVFENARYAIYDTRDHALGPLSSPSAGGPLPDRPDGSAPQPPR